MGNQKRMNVVLMVSPSVDRDPTSYDWQPAIWNHLRFWDHGGSIIKHGLNQVIASVAFYLEDDGKHRLRTVDISDECEGFDPELRTLVILGAGKKTWCGVDCGIRQLGYEEEPYGMAVILPPGVKPVSLSDLNKRPKGWMVIGSWMHRLTIRSDEDMVYQVVTVPEGTKVEAPNWIKTEIAVRYGDEKEKGEEEGVTTDEAYLLT